MQRLNKNAKLALAVMMLHLWTPAVASAVDPARAVSQYSLRLWQTKDGLPQNSINALVQTTDGYLWIGTDEGLARFDGRTFMVFDKNNTPELKGNRIATLQAGRDGSLWIGTKGHGLLQFKHGAFTRWTRQEGLPDNFVRAIYEASDGVLWIGSSDGGLTRHRDGQFKSITRRDGLFDDNISVILEDGQNNLWLSCDRGIFKVIGLTQNGQSTQRGKGTKEQRSLKQPKSSLFLCLASLFVVKDFPLLRKS